MFDLQTFLSGNEHFMYAEGFGQKKNAILGRVEYDVIGLVYEKGRITTHIE